MEVYDLYEWHTPATSYPRRKHGKAEIAEYVWEEGKHYQAYKVGPPDDATEYDLFTVDDDIIITNLNIEGETWMVDDPNHWWTIQKHAAAYEGRVLVAGLGLGLIVHALVANPAVSSVVVVERDEDVIALIKPLVPDCEIVCEDWYEYQSAAKVDGVFFDLFVGDGRSLIAAAISEMVYLRKRFPGILHRILGFKNEMLVQFCEEIETMQARAEELNLRGLIR